MATLLVAAVLRLPRLHVSFQCYGLLVELFLFYGFVWTTSAIIINVKHLDTWWDKAEEVDDGHGDPQVQGALAAPADDGDAGRSTKSDSEVARGFKILQNSKFWS